MYQCTKCKHTVEYTTNYCPLCGAETVQVEYVVVSAPTEPTAAPEPQVVCQPQPEPTPVEQPQVIYQQPQQPTPAPQSYYYAPTPESAKKPHIAKKIVGMVLSIEGIILAAIFLLYVIIFIALEPSGGAGAVMAICGAISAVPYSIVGLAMSNSCRNAGDTSRMSRAGKVLGILGIILTAVYLLIGFADFTDLFYYNGFYY